MQYHNYEQTIISKIGSFYYIDKNGFNKNDVTTVSATSGPEKSFKIQLFITSCYVYTVYETNGMEMSRTSSVPMSSLFYCSDKAQYFGLVFSF